MKSLLIFGVAILIAAGVAYVWVVPGALDQIGVEVTEAPAPAQPAKDDSRISTTGGEPSAPADSGDTPNVGVLDLTALPFETACGLHLTREGEEGIVFVNNAPAEANGEANGAMPAAMIIDGALLALSRTTADGETIGFGQYPRQVFDSSDNKVRVVVEVDFGDEADSKGAPVSAGELTVMKAGRPTLKFAVAGGAGC